MLTVETIARVRREHAKGRSVRAIARSLKLSRETVSKYLRSGETAPRYERQVQPYPQLAAFQKDLERLVEENDRQPVRDRLDYLGIFKRLQTAGYQGGYDAVRRYIRRWKQRPPAQTPAQAFVPLTFAPGEAYRLGGGLDRPGWGDDQSAGSPHPFVPQPDAVRSGLPAPDPGDGLRRPRAGTRLLWRPVRARDLRQHEDGGRDRVHR